MRFGFIDGPKLNFVTGASGRNAETPIANTLLIRLFLRDNDLHIITVGERRRQNIESQIQMTAKVTDLLFLSFAYILTFQLGIAKCGACKNQHKCYGHIKPAHCHRIEQLVAPLRYLYLIRFFFLQINSFMFLISLFRLNQILYFTQSSIFVK